MFALDLPPALHERVTCSIAASVEYRMPANILLAVAEKEGGRPGQWVANTDGTHDVGAMQFNTKYLRDLARYGITAADVAQPGCYPYRVAAWRIRLHLKNDSGDIWRRAANYHSRTPDKNAIYRADLKLKALKWAAWLDGKFKTAEFAGIDAKPIPSSTANNKASQELAQSRPEVRHAPEPIRYTPRGIIYAGAP